MDQNYHPISVDDKNVVSNNDIKNCGHIMLLQHWYYNLSGTPLIFAVCA